MEEVISAPRSPWQNPYVERLIGSIRRECLDHIIVWNQRSLRRTLQSYFAYTSVPELIWRWPKMLRNREPWRSQNAGASWRFLRSEDFTIATSARRLSPSGRRSWASGIVPWSCEPKSSRAKAKARSHPGYELLFALAALRFRNTLLAASKFPRSAILADGDRMRTRFSVMTGSTNDVWTAEHRIEQVRKTDYDAPPIPGGINVRRRSKLQGRPCSTTCRRGSS